MRFIRNNHTDTAAHRHMDTAPRTEPELPAQRRFPLQNARPPAPEPPSPAQASPSARVLESQASSTYDPSLDLTLHEPQATLLKRQDDFGRIAANHRLKAFFKLGVVKAMGDHRANIQTGLQHDGHLVPGLVHLPAVDSLDGQHVEDDGPPV